MWNPNDFEAPPDFMEALYGNDDEDNEEVVEFIEDEYLEEFSDEEVLIFFSKYYCAFYVLKKLRFTAFFFVE